MLTDCIFKYISALKINVHKKLHKKINLDLTHYITCTRLREGVHSSLLIDTKWFDYMFMHQHVLLCIYNMPANYSVNYCNAARAWRTARYIRLSS